MMHDWRENDFAFNLKPEDRGIDRADLMRACSILNVDSVRYCRANCRLKPPDLFPDASQEPSGSDRRLSTHQRICVVSCFFHEPRQKFFFDFVSKQGEVQTPLRNLNLNAQNSTSYYKSSHVGPEHALEFFVESLNRNKFDDHLVHLDLWAHFPLEDPVKHIATRLNANLLYEIRCAAETSSVRDSDTLLNDCRNLIDKHQLPRAQIHYVVWLRHSHPVRRDTVSLIIVLYL